MKKAEKKLSLGKVAVSKLTNDQLANVNGATGNTYMFNFTCKTGCVRMDNPKGGTTNPA